MKPLGPVTHSPALTRTAVIAPVPAAEPLVGQHRHHLDGTAAWGVPAHVTVLYPFVAAHQVDADVLARLAAAVGSVPAFDCPFQRTRWFGQDVLYLAPDPAQPFRDLTAAVWDAFPQHAPYRGAHHDVVPHLTVAERRLADLPALQAVERAVQPGLPLTARIDQVLLIAGSQAPASWCVGHPLPLGCSASVQA